MPQQAGRRADHGRAPSASKGGPLFAAVDLGTNNCRLLIAEPRPGGFRPVDSLSQPVRLGEGIARDGRISEAAIARGLDALGVVREKLRARGVGRVRCVATEACRAAQNGRHFIDRVRTELGLSFRVIEPDEEARLSVIGCHNLFAPDATAALVVDIGGGSTEISLVDVEAARRGGFKGFLKAPPLIDWGSFPLGVVTLTEAFEHLPEAERHVAMREHCATRLRAHPLADRVARLSDPRLHLVGTSGTVTSLAAVHLGLERYVRSSVDGSWMTREQTLTVTRVLCDMGVEGRRQQGCIGADRAELIVAGCAILDAVFDVWPAERIRVADRGLREGLLLSMMYGPKPARRRRARGCRGRRGGSGEERAGA